ncbi:hypothetical protein TCE0_017r03242 [Talaromyces pinophilus]|uniref:Zn(2)-C6 fungal-type domain-containing protein n=1 Tax=Talaromyces pinophilus TaxID=128442 RepID=A0A6V8H3A7_TALPI|nr:hypothetical protein TCE0_017r03242 [Talaromyces pinophilus]
MKRARRAAAACYTCHKRKVRCDALIHGQPCTNCRIDGRDDCTMRAKVSERDKPKRLDTNNTATNNRFEGSNPPHREPELHGNAPTSPHMIVVPKDNAYGKASDGNVIFSSYRFLDGSRLSSLPAEDVEYLISKRCLHFPRKDVLDEFVGQYFAMVHPFVPLLDEAEFWRIYNGAGTKKVSLLVFQAILFSACCFVPLETLQRCGFNDKRTARSELHRRAKILFDLKGEDRYLYRAQGCVLLSQHTSADDPHAGSLWIACAIRIAMTLNSYPLVPDIEGADQPTIKRLWWSILLRDRSLSLGLRRHPQVTAIEFMTDKDWLLNEMDFQDEFKNSQVYPEIVKRQLFAALQEQCRLAVLLTDALSILFTSPGPTAQSYAVEPTYKTIPTLEMAKENLLVWKNRSVLAPNSSSKRGSTEHEIVNLFTHITYMYYYTAQMSITHHEAMVLENQSQPQHSQDEYNSRVMNIGSYLRTSIEGLMRVIEYFYTNQSSVILPLSVLAYAGIPLILSAIDLKLSPSYSEMLTRRNRLDTFAQIIQRSRDLYEVTDVVAAGTNQILQVAYAITKKLFLSQGIMPVTTKTVNSKDVEPQRPTRWDEAYLRYPRAYLYISTSVEYSLSFGRMPAESVFPEQVRHVPSLVFGSKLSLTIDKHCIRFSDSSNPYLGTDYSTNNQTLVFGLEPVPSANRNMKTLMDKEASPPLPEGNHHADESDSNLAEKLEHRPWDSDRVKYYT